MPNVEQPTSPRSVPRTRWPGTILIIVALIIGLHAVLRIYHRGILLNAAGALTNGAELPWFEEASPIGRLPPEKRFLFTGDLTRKYMDQRQRALWERHPESRVFYGNYITHLVDRLFDRGKDPEKRAFFEAELERGEALDPDNARYNYLRAAFWFSLAAELEQNVTLPDGSVGNRLKIQDRALLDRAMAEVLHGNKKPFFKRYLREMQQLRMAALPPPERTEEYLSVVAILAGQLLPDLRHCRHLAHVTPLYARLLQQEGRRPEAREYLDTWEAIALKLNDDTWCLVDALVVSAILRLANADGAQLHADLLDDEAATRYGARISALLTPYNTWAAQRGGAQATRFDAMLRNHGGMLAALLLPTLGAPFPSDSELAPGRTLDQTLAEAAACSTALLVGAALLVLLELALICERWRRQPVAVVVPVWPGVCRCVLLGVLLPLAVYFVYARFCPGNGRTYNMRVMGERFGLELGLLLLVMLEFSITPALAWIRARHDALGLDLPPGLPTRRLRLALTALAVLMVAVSAVLMQIQSTAGPPFAHITGAVLGLLLLVMAMPAVRFALMDATCPRHRTYFANANRALALVFSAYILLVAGLVLPYLRARETTALQSDTLLGIQGDDGFTAVEGRLTRRLREGLQRAAAKAAEEEPRE